MPKLSINNMEVEVAEGATVLEAARKAGVHIPTLCYMENLRPSAPAACAWWKSRARAIWRPPASCRPRKA